MDVHQSSAPVSSGAARRRGIARSLGAALAWGVVAFLLTSVRIEMPGPMAFHTDLTEVALLGSALFLKRPWLTLIACFIEALNVVPPATLSLSLQTTFVMHAVAVPCAWYAHRAIVRRERSHLVLGLAWCGFVLVYYFALLMPLLLLTAELFIPASIAPPVAPGGLWESYWRIASAIPYEVLFTAGITALTLVTKEELRRRRRVQDALRAALDEQRALVVSAPLAVLTVRPDGVVSSWNPAAERLFGTPEAQALGAPVPGLRSRGDGEPLVTRVLAGTPLLGVEGEIAGASALVPVSVFGAPLGDGDAPQGAVLIVEDVREQLALRAEVQRSATMSALGELVGGLAHELRNPLFGISAALDAAGPHLVGNARVEKLDRTLRGQVDQLNALVSNLLDYGKSGAGDERVLGSLDVPLRHAVNDCAAHAAQAGATIELAVPPGLPLVPMDAARLVQAFRNLIQNAIAWSPAAAVVRVEASADAHGVRVEVLDQGRGFPDSDVARLFEPFFSRRQGGTGLGLSIVRRIVEHHGGSLEASNREGGGARLVVRLPTVVRDQ